jgi:hypothetical protein
MLEKIALPTPGFSDAPITAMDRGARKLFFDWLALNGVDEEDGDDADNEEGEEEPADEVDVDIKKVIIRTYKCVYPPSAYGNFTKLSSIQGKAFNLKYIGFKFIE